jgi:hypothetical protein
MKVYKDGVVANADPSQIKTLEKAGWSTSPNGKKGKDTAKAKKAPEAPVTPEEFK